MSEILSNPTRKILRRPMVEWGCMLDRLSINDREQAVRDLDNLIERASRLRGYVDFRGVVGSDRGHTKAVKNSNRLTTKIRRALGYTHPQQNLAF
jgi:hypothetical protein